MAGKRVRGWNASNDSVRHGRAGLAWRSDGAARYGRPDDPPGGGRHCADADDEGRRVCAESPRLPAQDRAGILPHRRNRRRRIADRRHGDAESARARRRCRASFPVLKRALRTLSNPRVRNVARVGGALAHGDPHMDLPPVLTALGASITVSGPNGTRELPLEAALRRLLRDRAGEERADHHSDGAGARRHARRPT